jgi:Helix-turn-helix
MATRTTTLTGGPGSRATGVVSGFVLRLARQSAALTQEKLAEALIVDVSTVQGWESGRRPLAAMHAGEFLRLSGRLSRLGSPASTGRHLREAIEADQVLSVGITAANQWVDPDTHPLAATVHRRTLTNLITWPVDGQAPQHLQVFTNKTRRRGPTPTTPALSADERTRFLDHLLTVAERACHADEALLRRQAVYLLGFDPRPHVVEWLRAEWRRAGHRTTSRGAVTGLLEARSAGVALASAGDPGRLHEFVDRMTGDPSSEIANLNYWAHWIGELGDDHTDDTFMLEHDTGSWTGVQLLQHLISRLDPGAAHLPLNLHALHTLIASRPGLLHHRPAVQISLATRLDRLGDSDEPTRALRDEIAGLRYALRLAER